MSSKVKKVVLAYSGGLDTSVILRWLIDVYDCEVIAFAADLGQAEELDSLDEKAKATGASKLYVEDLRLEFARDFVFPMLRAGAIYQDGYLLGTSIARPLIAKKQIEIAQAENADAVSHGATGKGNDQVRFELTYFALQPNIKVIAPWREWDFKGRADLIAYAEKSGIPVPVTTEKPYSSDRNLLHISFEGGILEDPWSEPPENMFVLSVSPEAAPDKPTYVEIDFEAGSPVAIDGEKLAPHDLLEKLNKLGGANGIGRLDLVEDRYVGMKSRGVYETPGGTIAYAARRALETITLDREVVRIREQLMPDYARLVYNGYWFAPERELLQKTFDESCKPVNGTVRLKLYKGNVIMAGRKAEKSLYDPTTATFEADDVYNQADAAGFIRLNALRLRLRKLLGA